VRKVRDQKVPPLRKREDSHRGEGKWELLEKYYQAILNAEKTNGKKARTDSWEKYRQV